MEGNRVEVKSAAACCSISKMFLYNYEQSKDYEYYGERPDDFPENKKFKPGVYFKSTYEYMPHSDMKHLVIREDKYGVQHAYLKPKIVIIMNDGTSIDANFASYESALNKYNKIMKQANLFEL